MSTPQSMVRTPSCEIIAKSLIESVLSLLIVQSASAQTTKPPLPLGVVAVYTLQRDHLDDFAIAKIGHTCVAE